MLSFNLYILQNTNNFELIKYLTDFCLFKLLDRVRVVLGQRDSGCYKHIYKNKMYLETVSQEERSSSCDKADMLP